MFAFNNVICSSLCTRVDKSEEWAAKRLPKNITQQEFDLSWRLSELYMDAIDIVSAALKPMNDTDITKHLYHHVDIGEIARKLEGIVYALQFIMRASTVLFY